MFLNSDFGNIYKCATSSMKFSDVNFIKVFGLYSWNLFGNAY